MSAPASFAFSPELQRAISALNYLCLEDFTIAAVLMPPGAPEFIRKNRETWIASTYPSRTAISKALPYILVDVTRWVVQLQSPTPGGHTSANAHLPAEDELQFPWSRLSLLHEALSALLWQASLVPLPCASLALGTPPETIQFIRSTAWNARSRLDSQYFPAPRWPRLLAFWDVTAHACTNGVPSLINQCRHWGIQLIAGAALPRKDARQSHVNSRR